MSKHIKITGVLPVEDAPVAEFLLCGVCRNIVVQVNKLWEEIFNNLCSHHCGELILVLQAIVFSDSFGFWFFVGFFFN